MTNFSISPSLRRVFPKVRIWVSQELMRSQKPDANKDPMDPSEQVAILDNHPYLLCSLWLCEFVINMHEVHIIFLIKEKRDVFFFLDLHKMHLQKLSGPSVRRTTAGCSAIVAPTLGVTLQSKMSEGHHAKTTYCCPPSSFWPLEWSLLRLLSTYIIFYNRLNLNLNIKVTDILYYWFLLLDQFRFCETHFTTYQRFVTNQSAISPFLGG